MKNARNGIGVALAIAACGLTQACGSSSDDGGGSLDGMNDDQVVASVQSKLSPAKTAFDKPSGVVDAKSMPRIIDSLQQSSAAGSAGSFAPVPFHLPSSSGVTTKDFEPKAADPRSCMTQAGSTVTMDMGCLSEGKATGTMVMRSVYQSGGSSFVAVIKYQKICVQTSSQAGQVCIDGEMDLEQTGTSSGPRTLTILEDFDITSSAGSAHVHAFLRFHYGTGSSDGYELAAFDGEASYVVTQSSKGVSVTGSNGRYDCTYTDSGHHGSCTGNGNTWTW